MTQEDIARHLAKLRADLRWLEKAVRRTRELIKALEKLKEDRHDELPSRRPLNSA
jgi:hypothetical protein